MFTSLMDLSEKSCYLIQYMRWKVQRTWSLQFTVYHKRVTSIWRYELLCSACNERFRDNKFTCTARANFNKLRFINKVREEHIQLINTSGVHSEINDKGCIYRFSNLTSLHW